VNIYAVYLWPRGSLASDIESDTLFGAVCWALATLKMTDVDKLLRAFDAAPRFAFSSTFPAYQSDRGILRFWPRPLTGGLTPQQVNRLAADEVKKRRSAFEHRPEAAAVVEIVEKEKRHLKKAAHVSEALFKEIVEQGLTVLELLQRLTNKGKQAGDIESLGGMLISYDERRRLSGNGEMPGRLASTEAMQHNQIDRVTGSAAEGLLFFEEETFFASGSGLWCVVAVDGDETLQWLQAAFRYLSDTGLGANRSTGKGHFQIEVGQALQLPDAGTAANAFVTLSKYLPWSGEWSEDQRPLSYDVKTVWAKREQKIPRAPTGAQSPPIYKEPLRMFMPGSVFPLGTPRQSIYGRLAEVVKAGDNGGVTVWQSGLAIPVFARVVSGGGG
jgi:CRISPR type III-A-associated RAMP protein Csm4